jgi:peptide/nickel transport system substrate-binding protein
MKFWKIGTALGTVAISATLLAPVAASATAKSNAKTGGILSVALTSTGAPNMDTDFAFGGGQISAWLGLQLYDGLTKFDLSNPKKAPTVAPDLATSWSSNAAGTLFTFKLRKGVTFTDGTPWNADAAVWNINRYVNPASPQYYPALASAANLYIGGIGSVTKVDNYTIQIATKNGLPDTLLPYDLTDVAMASPTAVQTEGNAGFALHPVGTGPFKFVSAVPNQNIVMAKNPNYWAGAPKLNELILNFIPDPVARTAALRAGTVNLVDAVNIPDIPTLKAQGYSVVSNVFSNVFRAVFDVRRPPFNNVLVRRALNLAINRKLIANSVLDRTATPAYQDAAKSDPGYVPALNSFNQYNPAKAKKLLAEAGYPNGITATFAYASVGASGGIDPNPVVAAMQQEFAAIGANITLVPMANSALLSQESQSQMPSGANMAIWTGTFILPSLWSSLTCNGALNPGDWCSADAANLLAQAKATTSIAKQSIVLGRLNTLAVHGAAWLPVVSATDPRALARTVHGFVDPDSWYVDLKQVWVS